METFFKNIFFRNNRNKLYKSIENGSLIVLFSADSYPRSGNQFFKFRQNSDIYYFSGLAQEESIVLLHKDKNGIIKEYAFIIEPNEKMLIWTGHKLTKYEAKEISGIENIEYHNNFENIFNKLTNDVNNIYYSFSGNIRAGNVNNKSVEEFKTKVNKEFPEKLQKNLDIHSHDLRVKKESVELETMKQACNITGEAFINILKIVKPGIYEYQIEAEMSRTFLSSGAQDFAYLPIVASGIDSCVLHYITNRKICKDGDLVLLDFGSELNYYASDVSRTIPISGKFTERQKNVYNSVLSVLKQIKQKMIPGNSIVNLNKECGELIEQELLKLGLIGQNDIKNQDPEKPAYKKYFMHGVSHYMGLDIHDVGDRSVELVPGMVLSCEPGIYIPEEGFGIRLENDILITNNKPVDLCEDIPIEAEEIEEIIISHRQ